MAEEKKTPPKKKRPTAQKRDVQNERKNLRNRMFKSRIKTATKNFEIHAKEAKESDLLQKELSFLFSLYDKGVKKGIIKINKARRKKSFYNKLVGSKS